MNIQALKFNVTLTNKTWTGLTCFGENEKGQRLQGCFKINYSKCFGPQYTVCFDLSHIDRCGSTWFKVMMIKI